MPTTRPPRGTLESITANCRPQPAIPAILVLMVAGLLKGAAIAGSSFAGWGLTAGLLASAGLAIAAGFCSFFPTVAWIALALLLFGADAANLALPARVALGAGIVAALAMAAVQGWRVRTGRFVPTITEPGPEAPDDAP